MNPRTKRRKIGLSAAIVEIFHKNRKAYGTRKIKVKLKE
ncbi:transposase InsO family protein [Paenibacillus sp. PastF-1]|nr:transposase InsO family protein [Paenibacillus sp. PastF-2]MDF9856849.1 transposase InsO family protein [Paenibacillus sp. PastF-1]